MRAERWKQAVMFACFAMLVVAMGVVFTRFGTAQVLIKRLHQDNAVTQFVFHDDPDIHLRNQAKPEKKVDWAREYPFADAEQLSLFSRVLDKSRAFESRVTKGAETKVEEWTTKHFWQYPTLVESGRHYENAIGWQVVNPSQQITKLADGSLTFAYPLHAQQERVDSMVELADFAKEQGAQLLFVQAPFKVDAYGDEEVNGKLDFSNQNADELLAGLHANGIEVMDLREDLHEAAPTSEAYHRFFYRTDHHWRPQAALLATDLLAQRLQAAGIPIERAAYNPAKYQVETRPAFFLGSQGKKVTLAKTEPDDFDVVTPDFSVKLHVEMPSLDVDATGGFDLLLDPRQIERQDYYNLNPYAFYGHGDMPLMRIENLNQPDNGKKVLFIRDSFCDTLVPYFALGCRRLVSLDLRHFTGSLETLIREEKPDVIVVMYTASYVGKIDWSGHEDKFDFR